jgi:hypothetical protein
LFAARHSQGAPAGFAAVLTAWDALNLRSTGPVLFAAAPLVLDASVSTFVPLLFNTGGVQLVGGSQYVAFLTTSVFFDGVPGFGEVAAIPADVYSAGGAVALDNGGDLALLQSTPWLSTPADLAFAAVFSAPSAVPEPSTYGLIAAAFLLCGVWFRRRGKVVN